MTGSLADTLVSELVTNASNGVNMVNVNIWVTASHTHKHTHIFLERHSELGRTTERRA